MTQHRVATPARQRRRGALALRLVRIAAAHVALGQPVEAEHVVVDGTGRMLACARRAIALVRKFTQTKQRAEHAHKYNDREAIKVIPFPKAPRHDAFL